MRKEGSKTAKGRLEYQDLQSYGLHDWTGLPMQTEPVSPNVMIEYIHYVE